MKLKAAHRNLFWDMRLQRNCSGYRCRKTIHDVRCYRVPVLALTFLTLTSLQLFAQDSLPGAPGSVLIAQQSESASPQSTSQAQTSTPPATKSSAPPTADPDRKGVQTKRILGVIPNYRSVSADTELPPQSFKDKFMLATKDSFDYSSFILAGAIAGVAQAQNSYPEFHQGAAGYGRYYWHAFADQAVGNYMTEAIVPSFTREDSRYYTLGHGNVFHRSGYAVSRLFITRTDSGGRTFNVSEIGGNLAGAAISNTYYPSHERTWTKTQQKWFTQVGLDGVFNLFKEFWPDINRAVFHQRY